MQVQHVSGVVMAVMIVATGCGPQTKGAVTSPPSADNPVRFEARTNETVVTDRASTGGVSWVDVDGDGRYMSATTR